MDSFDFYWIYDIPTWEMVGLFTAVFVGFTWIGILFARPILRLFVSRRNPVNDLVGYLLGAHGVYFGILLGLLAVSAYQNFTQSDTIVAVESSRLAILYRDVSALSEPHASELKAILKDYTSTVIEKDWPQQRDGIVPNDSTKVATRFHMRLVTFEPATKGQEILFAESLRAFNGFIEARRLRLNAVTAGIPGVLWYVVMIGAGVNILLVWLLDMKLIAHLFLGGVTAFFLATLIALVAAMDNPFRGEVSVSPSSFQLIFDQLMTPAETR
jgi:hypothetical protein